MCTETSGRGRSGEVRCERQADTWGFLLNRMRLQSLFPTLPLSGKKKEAAKTSLPSSSVETVTNLAGRKTIRIMSALKRCVMYRIHEPRQELCCTYTHKMVCSPHCCSVKRFSPEIFASAAAALRRHIQYVQQLLLCSGLHRKAQLLMVQFVQACSRLYAMPESTPLPLI